MRKLILLLGCVFFAFQSFSQPLSGTKTIKYSGGDYNSIASAIADLNSKGVGTGGVIFQVNANFREIASNMVITASGSAGSEISFVKFGSGSNPVITAAPGSGGLDAFIKLSGSDYVTFDGIDLKDTSSNGTNNTKIEWGYALLKKPADTSGCQHVIIANCNITMNKTDTSTYGIFCHNIMSSAGSMTTIANINKASQTNSYNKFYNNTITNSYNGIRIAGTNNILYFDQGNEIGTLGGNTITNFGGTGASLTVIYCTYQNGLKVHNNTIKGTHNMGTNNSFYGIYTANGMGYGNVDIEIINNNIQIYTNGNTGSMFSIYNSMGSGGTTNTVLIYKNTLRGMHGGATWTGTCYGIGNNSSPNTIIIRKNTIDSISLSGNNNNIYGISQSGQAKNIFIDSNYINSFDRAGSGNMFGISQRSAASAALVTVRANEIFKFTAIGNVTMAGISTDQGGFGGSTFIASVYANKIYNFENESSNVYGITASKGDTTRIFRNKIYDLTSQSANPNVAGIIINSGSKMYAYNNIISDLKAPIGANFVSLSGINVGGGTEVGLYFNTIYLNASSSGATFGTAGIYASAIPSVELRNNLIYNLSTANGATGKTAGYYRSSSNLATYVSTSNNNLIYCGTPSSKNVIFCDGTNYDSTIAQYRTRVSPKDANSITESTVPFVNKTTTPYDLHLTSSTPTQCESGGSRVNSPLLISDDFDGSVRDTITPDIGADEGVFILLDLMPPSILYTPLQNTISTSSRSLTATIVDPNGVPTSGSGLPRLYWRKHSVPSWTAVTGSNSGSTYTFNNIGNLVATGDTVFYYIVAQDNNTTVNVGSQPAGASGFTINPPAASAPPPNPEFYLVTTPFSGVYYVGVGKDYTTLTSAIAAYNSRVLSGPVTFNLTDVLYTTSETFPIVINENPGSSPANTLTIKPNTGVKPTIKGITSTLIKLNGADNVIIDGSNSGTETRDLKFRNDEPSNESAAIWVCAGTNGSKRNTIKNCIIYNGSYYVSNFGIFVGGNALTSGKGGGGSNNDNLTIENNRIVKVHDAIMVYGNNSGVIDSLLITKNLIGDDTLDNEIGNTGIWLQNTNGAKITENVIHNVIGNSSSDVSAIEIGSGANNTLVARNKIYDVKSNLNPSNGAYGINVSSFGGSVNNAIIQNNLIYHIITIGNKASTQKYPVGIRIASGNNHKIYYNTINMYDSFQNTTDTCMSVALLISSYFSTGIDVMNNIFVNTVKGRSGSQSYAIHCGRTAALDTIGFNNYYGGGTCGILGYISAPITTLSAWKAALTKDSTSVSGDPMFSSKTDLHFANGLVNNTAKPIYINYDFTGAARSTTIPDMGAYEMGIKPRAVTKGSTAIQGKQATLLGKISPNNELTDVTFEYGTTTSYGTTINAIPAQIGGFIDSSVSVVLTGIYPNTQYHYRVVASNASGSANGYDSTFTTLKIPPFASTDTVSDIWSTKATVYGTINPNNLQTTVKVEYGKTTSYGTTQTVGTNFTGVDDQEVNYQIKLLLTQTLYHYRFFAINSAGTTYGEDKIFTTKNIGINSLDNDEILVRANGKQVLVAFSGEPVEVVVHDATGKVVYSGRLNSEGTLDLNNQSTGVYVVTVIQGENVIRHKIVLN